ncbi:CRAL/TRIO domain protein [Peziza echinospora]|nr:CRAL/TRIO domain protein [Peziza echinospora]
MSAPGPLPIQTLVAPVQSPSSPVPPSPIGQLLPEPTHYNPPPHPREVETNKKLTPFASPLPTSTPLPPAALTPIQLEKYNLLLTSPLLLSSATESVDKLFLTKECLLRFLRASKWDVPAALTRLQATLVWRKEFGIDEMPAEAIEPEQLTGKQWIVGYDIHGRPCLSLNPARQNTEQSPRQIQHLVWMLERAIELMPPGQETLALVIDFLKSTSSKSPSISTGKQVLNILQNHYPERLGKAICMNLPWFTWGFFKLITPFIDPLTREKLVFDNNAIKALVPLSQLETRFGGQCDFEYEHDVYWPAFVQLCRVRRAEYIERWTALGGTIGISEVLLKGGSEEVDLLGGSKETGGTEA